MTWPPVPPPGSWSWRGTRLLPGTRYSASCIHHRSLFDIRLFLNFHHIIIQSEEAQYYGGLETHAVILNQLYISGRLRSQVPRRTTGSAGWLTAITSSCNCCGEWYTGGILSVTDVVCLLPRSTTPPPGSWVAWENSALIWAQCW